MVMRDAPRPPDATAVVAVAIMANGGSDMRSTVAGLRRQMYAPAAVAVVGSEEQGLTSFPTLERFLAELPAAITHIWLLHGDAVPIPDTLAALVLESSRTGAGIAGCKVLLAEPEGAIESVGIATDVLEVPYPGVDPGEVDQQQYDVVRDVAYVGAPSLLVERELLVALGGTDPLLAPESAAIDLAQRARLAGARVVVVPSAEVMHANLCRESTPPWREDAGRLRALLKAYQPLTLMWVVPLAFTAGLAEGIVRLRLGRFLRAWAWNLAHFPSTLTRRREIVRRVGDEELFRYQLRGLVKLRRWGERLVHPPPGTAVARSLSHWAAAGEHAVRQPNVFWALVAGVVAVVLVRSLILDGLPLDRFSAPFPDSAADALRSAMGGWNVAGLGSPEPSRPAVGWTALAQGLSFGRAGWAEALLSLGAAWLGLVSFARMLGRWGISVVPSHAGALVMVAGPAAAAIGQEGAWPALAGLGFTACALSVLFHPWQSGVGQIRRVTLAALATGLASALVPPLLVVPLLAVVVWTLLSRKLSQVPLVAGAATMAAIPMLLPWIAAGDVGRALTAGVGVYWRPGWWVLVPAAAAAVAVLAVGRGAGLGVGSWGAVLAVIGAIVARSGSFGWGTELGWAGLVIASLGGGGLVAAGLDGLRRSASSSLARRLLTGVGGLGSVVLAVLALAPFGLGRWGLGSSDLVQPLALAGRASGEASARALIIGPPETMLGEARTLSSQVSYRVVSVPEPRLWELWLPTPRLGDQALAEVIGRISNLDTFRAGEELAAFGIRWVIPTVAGQLDESLRRQLDLREVLQFDTAVFENRIAAARATDADGDPWVWEGPDYQGPARATTVRIAENGDERWAPGDRWRQDGWANAVSTDEGTVSFRGIGQLRLLTQLGFGYAALLGLASLIRSRR